jgi:hypothetical protein
MARAIYVFLVCCIALSACTQRMICPAYQSAFIYDQEALRKKFSYFNEDSTPKVLMASKSKYLIAAPVSYQKKIRSMQTVEMKPVFPIVPDSLRDDYEVSLAELDSAARSVIDSTFIVDTDQTADSLQHGEDSVYVITKDKEVRLLKYDPDSLKYKVVDVRLNVDQDNYMWYLRDYLVLPDVRLARLQSGEKAKNAAGKKEKKGFFGFFKNLFKKKKKEPIDSATLVPVKDENDFDFVDTTAIEKPVVKAEPSKKKKKKEKEINPGPQEEADTDEAVSPEEKPAKRNRKKKKDEAVPATDPEEKDKPSRMGDEKEDDGF